MSGLQDDLMDVPNGRGRKGSEGGGEERNGRWKVLWGTIEMERRREG